METQQDQDEVWRPIPGFEKFYEASTHGRVRSLPRIVHRKNNGPYLLAARIMKPGAGVKAKYLGLQLCGDGVKTSKYVHHIILETFVGPAPDGMEACHGDGDRTNNRLSNLRWDTRKANAADRVVHGTVNRGENSASSKLTNEIVLTMRQLRKDGMSVHKIAAKFNVSVMTASRATRGESWSHLK